MFSYQDHQAMVAQLEHQFRLGRLSIQGLWFYCQVLSVNLKKKPNLLYKNLQYEYSSGRK